MQTNKQKLRLTGALIALLASPLFKQGTIFAQSPNIWTQKANFAGGARDGAFAFSIGTKGYMGAGNRNGAFKNDVWEYDPATNAWTQKAGVPANEYLASSFVIGSKAYVGCGYNTNNAFYEFDPVANTWTSKASFPGVSRYITAGFSVGAKGYCGAGYTPVNPYPTYNDFYEFDPIANTWTVKASIPGGGRTYAVGFNIGSKGYLGTGNVNANGANDFYEYDPAGNTWTTKASVGPVGRVQSFGIAMNGKGYIGGGGQGYDPTGFYEYDAAANTWTAKASIPVVRAGAVGFGIGTKLYIGTGGDPFDTDYYGSNYYYRNDFYEWSSCGINLSVSPVSSYFCGTGAATLTASGAQSYIWSNGMANGGTVTPSVTTHYTVTGVNTGTCPATNSAVVAVIVNTVPVNQTVTPIPATVACSGNSNINLTTEAGVNYYLRNDANNAVIGEPYTGTGGTISIPTGNLITSTTFNINAKKTSGGILLDGVNDEIRTTAGNTFNFAGDFTIETWVKSPLGENQGTKVIIGMPGSYDVWLGYEGGGRPNFTIGGGVTTGTFAVNDGKWHHLAAVREAGIKYLYVDGVLAATGNNSGTASVSSYVEIGGYAGSYNFLGQLDDVKIWNIAHTQAQVANSMTACATGAETGLLLLYNFEEAAGSTQANDVAGLDNNGELVNMNLNTAWNYGVDYCITCGTTQLTTKPIVTVAPVINQPALAVNPDICVSGTTGINLTGSQPDVNYYLRDNSNNAVIDGPLVGTGSNLTFTTGLISATTTYNIYAKKVSGALNFDGTNDYVATNIDADVDVMPVTTWEAWIYPTDGAYSGDRMVMSMEDGGWDRFVAIRNGTFMLGYTSDGWFTNVTADLNQWQHIAVVYSGSDIKFYKNGVEYVFGSSEGGHTSTGYFTIGANEYGSQNFMGTIDEVSVWNTVRVQAQIQSDMNSCFTGTETGLAGYYTFENGSRSAILTDVAGADNTGTLTNIDVITAWTNGVENCGCSLQMSSTPVVTIHALPTVSAASVTICAGNTATIVPSGASTYTISGGSFTVNPSADATYSVTGTSSVGCVSSNTAIATVSVNALPTVSANATNPVICNGESTVLTSGGTASSYTWTNGVIENTAFSPTVTTDYTVTGTDGNGCKNIATQLIAVNDLPTVTASATGSILCLGESTTLNGGGAITYTWTNSVSDNSVFTPTVTETYTVTGTDANGCQNMTTQVITVNSLPVVTVNSGVICAGESFTMIPGGAVTYTFSNGSNVVAPMANSMYSVSGTDVNGCSSIIDAVSTITVNTLPVLAVNNGVICAGQSFTMFPAGALTYTYSSLSNVVTPTADATYSVSGTDANGCVSLTDAISSVTVNALPAITAATSNTLLCTGQTATLSVTGSATSYTWSTAETTMDIAVTPTTTTTYTVDGVGSNGCSNSTTVTQDVSLCTGLAMVAGAPEATIRVYPNPNNGVFFVELTADSKITITNALGEVVMNEAVDAGKHQLDLHNEANGLYFVKVVQNYKQQIIKMIRK